MVVESLIITSIVCGTAFAAYVCKLLFFSKCDECSAFGITVHRKTEQEAQTTGDVKLPNIIG